MTVTEDLNTITLTGKVYGKPLRTSTGDGLVLSFALIVQKAIRGAPGVKVSTFKVVMFDTQVLKHEADIFDGQTLLVTGELDETKFFKNDKVHEEVRVVSRFLKILGAS